MTENVAAQHQNMTPFTPPITTPSEQTIGYPQSQTPSPVDDVTHIVVGLLYKCLRPLDMIYTFYCSIKATGLQFKYVHIHIYAKTNRHAYICNELGGNMARFTQFPIMITRSTIIYEIISPGAAGSSIYV